MRPTPTELVFRSLLHGTLPVSAADTMQRLLVARASRVELIAQACARAEVAVAHVDNVEEQAIVLGREGRQLARVWFEADATGKASVRWELSDEVAGAVKRWLEESGR